MYVSPHIYNMYEASPPSRPLRQRDFSLFTKIRKCNSHSSFFILHSSFNNCVSTIFPSSLFTKRKCNSHSSFFILHSSFFILHSSFKKSPSVGRVTARYFPCYLLFPLTHINETANNAYFSKKYPQKFW